VGKKIDLSQKSLQKFTIYAKYTYMNKAAAQKGEIMKKIYHILIATTIVVAIALTSHAHPGRTDASGGHYNRKTGGYHYHNSGGGSSSTPEPSTPYTQPAKSYTEEATPTTTLEQTKPAVITAVTTTIPVLEKPDFNQIPIYSVVRVIDGDTIVIDIDSNSSTVRLIGVDTPETVHPSKPVEEYGKEASNFTHNLLVGEKVYIAIDLRQGKTDIYGRILAYVYRFPDGLFVNAEIVRQGYGHAYTAYPFKYMEEFRQLERFARQSQKGLWASETATTASKASPIPPVLPSAVKVEPKTESTEADITVYVTRTGAKYHRGSCRYLSKSKIPISLEEAKTRYSPCSVCSPPQ
jgi:micrococcal nuclease